MRHAARVDANQSAIVEALRRGGCYVWPLKLPVDLLVGKGGKTVLVEVKTKSGKYTQLQSDFMAAWPGGAVATIRDVEGAEALARML